MSAIGPAPAGASSGTLSGWWTPSPLRHLDPARLRGDRVLGVVLVVLWAAWLALTLLTAPRWVSIEQLDRDVAAGRVVAVDDGVLDRRQDGRNGWTDAPRVLLGEPGSGAGVDVLVYYVDGPFARTRVVDDPGSETTRELARALTARGVPTASSLADPWFVLDTPQGRPLWAGVPLVGLFLSSLLLGPGPTRGSRWFWFWTMFFTAGLGVLAYAASELVRPGRPRRRPRLTGLVGFLVMIFVGPLVAHLLSLPSVLTGWVGFLRF